MTDADRSPFRRFPRLQLVFCLACLCTAAWTWMRYSYVWNATVGELREALPMSTTRWPYGAFVRIRGRIVYEDDLTGGVWLDACVERYPVLDARLLTILDAGDDRHANVLVPKQWAGASGEEDYSFTGRLACLPWTVMELGDAMAVDTTSPRLVPQSVAGLAVGAMGCFVFGLYLRRWLLERKAARAATAFTTETQSSQRTS